MSISLLQISEVPATNSSLYLLVVYRVNKATDGNRLTIRPTGRLDYNLTRRMHLEVAVGVERVHEQATGTSHKSFEFFLSAGYRLIF